MAQGSQAQLGWAVESTQNTRQTPTDFLEFVQENVQYSAPPVRSRSLSSNKFQSEGIAGLVDIRGSIGFELQTEGLIELLRLFVGGSPSTSGSDPYTHVYTPDTLPSGTFQIGRPMGVSSVSVQPFDVTGAFVSSWGISQAPGEFANVQFEILGYDMLTNQTLATQSLPATKTPLAFSHATVTLPDAGSVCFDTFEFTVDNGLSQTYKSCSTDAGKPLIQESAFRSMTGSLTKDFDRLTDFSTFKAGTHGDLSIAWTNGSYSLTVATSIRYTAAEQAVTGPDDVKQTLSFETEIESGDDDTDALTVTLVNNEAS